MSDTLNKNYIVEKSKPLIWSKFSEYNLGEMRLIDTYLAKINARESNSSEVVFGVDEYLELLGYSYPNKVKSKDIEESLDRLLGSRIKIDLNNNGDYIKVNLFSDARVVISDPEFGKRTITIDCNPKLKEAFFGLAEKGYVEYKLDYSLRLKSKYAIRLYPLLKDNLYKREWSIDLKNLRELIGATNKNNESFREFNKVLQKCEEDINNVTDIEFSYEKITKGRLTRGIVFKIKRKKESAKQLQDDSIDEGVQMDLETDFPEYCPPEQELTLEQRYIHRVNDEAFNAEFNYETAEYLIEIGKSLAQSRVPEENLIDAEAAATQKITYYREKYLQMRAGATSKSSRSRSNYLAALIKADVADSVGFKKDTSDPEKYVPKNKFSNFENRKYDFNELEKMLLLQK